MRAAPIFFDTAERRLTAARMTASRRSISRRNWSMSSGRSATSVVRSYFSRSIVFSNDVPVGCGESSDPELGLRSVTARFCHVADRVPASARRIWTLERMLNTRTMSMIAVALITGQLLVRGWLAATGDFYWDDLVLIA